MTEGDDESVDNRSATISDDGFRDKLMDVVEVILSVDSRLKSVEKKFNNGPPPPPRPPPPPPHTES